MDVQVFVKRGRKLVVREPMEEEAPVPSTIGRIYLKGETVTYDRLHMPTQSSVGRHGRRPGCY